MIKILTKLNMEGTYLNTIIANAIFNSEKLKAFLIKSWTRQGYPLLTTSRQYSIGSQLDKKKKWTLSRLEGRRLNCHYVRMCVHQLSSVQLFSHVDSLWPHEPQHTRPSCPSPTPGVHPNPCPLSWWCHPTILSSVVLFSSCPPSFPASGSFQMSHLFASGGQSIGVSASTSVLPMNTQDWSPLGWTGWISL